jgi:CheY-like chemotaxis protein/HPt (histidine-containing phosphotransfer) domain-containing protein
MTVREHLFEISGLSIASKLTKMGDNELDEYVQILNSFVEKFPAQDESAKNALGEKDYLSLSQNLASIKDMLVQIHADSLAEDCVKQMNEITGVNHEKIETFVTHFLSMLTMLSIDIQMAIFRDGSGQPVKVADKPAPRSAEKTILAVDDNAFFLDMLKGILYNTEYKLTCVISSRDALRYLQNHRPNLFILDIEMPQLNGYELAKKIRDGGHTAPIIFLTANATREYLVKAVHAGAVDFIAKPPSKEYVLPRIAKYI